MLKTTMEGKLTAKWREEHKDKIEPASILLERILKERRERWREFYSRSKLKDPLPPLNTFVKLDEWVTVTIDMIAYVGTGTTPHTKTLDYYENGNIPWLKSTVANQEYVKQSENFVTDKALKETRLKLYPPGTLLVALYGEGKTRGKCTELRIEATINQALASGGWSK